ncbi:uncharacterized protein isoform X2 [Rhodnius prolixus]|uniref:uncharacterized protein isoform X2 n=1 Tax=Rhodnius prolixus TaxID=13249 RepID=UPI003D18C63C
MNNNKFDKEMAEEMKEDQQEIVETRALEKDLKKSEKARIHLSKEVDKIIDQNQKAMLYYQERITSMGKALKESQLTHMKLKEEITRVRKGCANLLMNKELLEIALQELHGLDDMENLLTWLETKEIHLSLLTSEKKITELQEQIENLLLIKKTFDEKEQSLKNEIKGLTIKLRIIEKEKEEAFTTFDILSTYFSDKNIALKAELKEKEEHWLNNPSDASLIRQMKNLREENVYLKNINEESTKLNLQKDRQLLILQRKCELKDIENWMLKLKLDRRVKVAETEASLLRRKLLIAETNKEICTNNQSVNWQWQNESYTLPPHLPYDSTSSILQPFACLPVPPILNKPVVMPSNYSQEIPTNIKPIGHKKTESAQSLPKIENVYHRNYPSVFVSASNPEIIRNDEINSVQHSVSDVDIGGQQAS